MAIRLISSPASVRIMGAFLVVMAIFAVAAVITWRAFDQINTTTVRIVEETRGLEAALRIKNLAIQMEALQANLVAGGDVAREVLFDKMAADMTEERRQLLQVTATPRARDMLARCGTLQAQAETIYHMRFIPALMSRQERDVIREQDAGRRALLEIQRIVEQLKSNLERTIVKDSGRATELASDTLAYSGWLLFAAAVIGVTAAIAAARSVVTPIHRLIDATQAVSRGDLYRQLDENRPDEFGRLAASFNRMTRDLRESQRRLVQAEKMASVGRLAAGVAHEINNPIGVILGYAKMMLADASLPPGVREDLKAIEEEAGQCKEIVEGLLNFSRAAPPADTVIDLRHVIIDLLNGVEMRASEKHIKLIREIDETPLPIKADAVRLRQVIRNIIKNAFDAMEEKGGILSVRVRASIGTLGKEDKPPVRVAEASFSDTGCGIAPEDVERLFEPFFSKKSGGTGLGLSIAWGVVRAYGGVIDVRGEPGRGATFILRIPLAETTVKRSIPKAKETV